MIFLKDISIGHKEPLFKVNDLSLKVGELVVLIGPNGAGKTTFFNTLLGSHSTLSGSIQIDERKLNSYSPHEKTELFAFVPSRFNGVEHLSVRELVALGRAPYTNILNRLGKLDIQKIDQLLAMLKIDGIQDQLTTQISDGERQIAMIGKALAQSTRIILLDEPTAFLDYSNRKKVLQLLKDLSEQENKLILVSSHDIELCFSYADRIIAVDQKRKKLQEFLPPYSKKEIVNQIFEM